MTRILVDDVRYVYEESPVIRDGMPLCDCTFDFRASKTTFGLIRESVRYNTRVVSGLLDDAGKHTHGELDS